MSPKVLLCDNLTEVLRSLPGGRYFAVGTSLYDWHAAKRILKDTAPLASEQWHIYIERKGDGTVNYGVFAFLASPTSIPLEEAITISPNVAAISVERSSRNSVSLNGSKGRRLTVVFSTMREPDDSVNTISDFSAECTKSLDDPSFTKYFASLLSDAVLNSHGSIIIVAKNAGDILSLDNLGDAVRLNPPLDFYPAFREFVTAQSSSSILDLQRSEQLLRGILQCDGIIAFDDCARISGYRIFFKETNESKAEVAKLTPVVGGARRRAYQGVQTLVGKSLSAALFRSQDGTTLLQKDA